MLTIPVAAHSVAWIPFGHLCVSMVMEKQAPADPKDKHIVPSSSSPPIGYLSVLNCFPQSGATALQDTVWAAIKAMIKGYLDNHAGRSSWAPPATLVGEFSTMVAEATSTLARVCVYDCGSRPRHMPEFGMMCRAEIPFVLRYTYQRFMSPLRRIRQCANPWRVALLVAG